MTCIDSEKQDKRFANRKFRRYVKQVIFEEVLPLLREVSNIWTFGKDGKQYVKDDEDVWRK